MCLGTLSPRPSVTLTFELQLITSFFPGGDAVPRVWPHHTVAKLSKPQFHSSLQSTHAQVETLFHEFGHALNSLLSRTEFQHLAGGRFKVG